MRATKLWSTLSVLLLVAFGAACTSDALDDGDGPDVVLEVFLEDNPPVRGQLTPAGCGFQIEEWTLTLTNLPKNSAAVGSSPFNDIVVTDVDVLYNWLNPANRTPPRNFGTFSVAVPVDGTNTISFFPISPDDLLALAFPDGSLANLTMTFNAHTIEGTRMRATVGGQLFIESCAN